jgi:hypothetical protein
MDEAIKEITLVKAMKNVARKIYYSIISKKNTLKVNEKNYFDIYIECDQLFDSIFKPMEIHKLNKSLFLDFMNFQLQVNYCFEMIVNNEMTTQEITTLMHKEKSYLDYTFQSITNIDISEI